MKAAVVYYSYGGNTRKIANKVSSFLAAESFEIETEKPYNGSYNDVVSQGKKEVEASFMPKLKSMDIDLASYDTVVLLTPVWWYTMAPAMKSFLSQYPLSDKRVYIVATNGGWIGRTIYDIQNAIGHKAESTLDVRFNGTRCILDESVLSKWVSLID